MQYADIIIDISHEQLDRTFQYAVPPELEERIQVGSPVVIPFGKGNRAITGYVVNLTDEPNWDPAKIKPIARIPSEGVPIESHLIALAYWMKSHYGATMNQALRTVIPIKQKAAPKEKKVLHLLLEEQQLQDVYTDLISRKRHSIPKQRLFEALMEQPDIPWDVVTGKLGIASTVIRDF
ncbi:MAG: primosomal protein N', partial [Lachnospiraceae bacterium]|nr:primosomal protein N' [Lachnospiraceae bacterium]